VSQAEILSLFITAVALALFLPLWGITGAAVASLLAYGTALLFLAFRLRHVHRISPRAVLVLHRRDIAILLEYAWQLFGTMYRRIAHPADGHNSA
jgi:Na+-driven multidrug efflux pump